MGKFNVTVLVEVEADDESHAVSRVEEFMTNAGSLDVWDSDGHPINIWYYVSDEAVEDLEEEA